MTALPPHLFVERYRRAADTGIDSQLLDRSARAQAEMLRRGLEPIVSLGHLSQLTGASTRYLNDVVTRRSDPYNDIRRPKKDGTRTRSISSPEPVLMDVQRWILGHALRSVREHDASFAYTKDRSIRACAERHLGARWLIKIDLHDFFHSIHEARVYRLFKEIGYPSLTSFELGRLCSRMIPRNGLVGSSRNGRPYPTRFPGVLPQGAPTSGKLANAAARGLDEKLTTLARSHGLVYTRYSDDITFSAGHDITRGDARAIVASASALIRSERFVVHHQKTRVVPPGARHVVLGLVLGADRVQLRPEFKRNLNNHIRGVEKFGLVAHAQHRSFVSIFSFINHIDGHIAFARDIDKELAERARLRWDSALVSSGFPVR